MNTSSHKQFKDWLDEWNRIHCIEIKKGAEHRNEYMADWLEKTLSEAKEIYYTSGEVIMDDMTYDNFEDKLKTLRPTSKFLEKVGY